jgi:hypothetical protein
LSEELRLVQSILARGCPTEIADHLQRCGAYQDRDQSHQRARCAGGARLACRCRTSPIYQQLLSQTLWEGVRIIRAAGYREYRIPGIPSFALLHLLALLPGWVTRPMFKRRAARHADVEHDAGRGSARRARHRA